jgi:uncharacterized protein YjbI with pentapeptide repeats
LSFSVVVPSPWNTKTNGAKLLDLVGIRTYADLREVEVAQKPERWDGKDWSKVKRVDLRDRNLAFADAENAFLANADLRDADLAGANLRGAQLQGADLRGAQLQGADLSWAQLQGADLRSAKLQGADLRSAKLQGADLRYAQLQGADLRKAALWRALVPDATWDFADLRGSTVEPMTKTKVTKRSRRYRRPSSTKAVGRRLSND